MWITPKTTWVATDSINYEDYNRIGGNIEHIADEFDVLLTPHTTQDEADFPYPVKWNLLEDNLELLNQATYDFVAGVKKQFSANTGYIDYIELNRLESLILHIQNVYLTQLANSKHLSFRLGGDKMLFCPRNINNANANVMGNRLQVRLGNERGEYADE